MASLLEQLERRVMRRFLGMPHAAQRALFGESPRNDEGAPLDMQTHVLLQLMEKARKPDIHELSVEDARGLFAQSLELLDFEPCIEGHDFDADGVTVRAYRPDSGVHSCMVYYHGGGFTLGHARDYDGICSYLAREMGVLVVSVDYRRAPESVFPAAVDDSLHAYRWVRDHAELLEHDGRLIVAGDSAGGNLAAVISQQLVVAGEPLPELQVLIYPTTDDSRRYDSMEFFCEGFFLTTPTRDWFSQLYVAGAEKSDPRVSPVLFERPAELPETYLTTTGFDPLRDEGRAYARVLREAGVQVHERCEDQLVHGYITQGGAIDAARRAVDDMIAEVVHIWEPN